MHARCCGRVVMSLPSVPCGVPSANVMWRGVRMHAWCVMLGVSRVCAVGRVPSVCANGVSVRGVSVCGVSVCGVSVCGVSVCGVSVCGVPGDEFESVWCLEHVHETESKACIQRVAPKDCSEGRLRRAALKGDSEGRLQKVSLQGPGHRLNAPGSFQGDTPQGGMDG